MHRVLSSIPGGSFISYRDVRKPHIKASYPRVEDEFIHSRVRIDFRGNIASFSRRRLDALSLNLPESKKRENTIQEALILFSQYAKEPDTLLAHLKRGGLQIYSAVEFPWVGEFLEQNGHNASFYMPYSLNHLQPSALNIEELRSNGLPSQLSELFIRCENGRSMVMMLRAGTAYSTFLHECLHVLQALNGLPMKAESPAQDIAATRVLETIRNRLSNPHYSPKHLRMELSDLRRDWPEIYQALLIKVNRENEVERFFKDHAGTLEITWDREREDRFIRFYDTILQAID